VLSVVLVVAVVFGVVVARDRARPRAALPHTPLVYASCAGGPLRAFRVAGPVGP
jgi:hypothetical protein